MNHKANNLIDFEIENGVLKKYNGNESHVVIPYGVTSIGDYAFESSRPTDPPLPLFTNSGLERRIIRLLESIIIPNSVTSIGDGAFINCQNLRSIYIPKSVTHIGSLAFWGCTSLKGILIPDNVTFIGAQAFDKTAFYNNSNNWDNGLYIGNHLIQAEVKKSTYKIKLGTKTIAAGACAWTNIKTLIIPNSVVSICRSAFFGCGLKSVHYAGTAEEWNNIDIGKDNYELVDGEKYGLINNIYFAKKH